MSLKFEKCWTLTTVILLLGMCVLSAQQNTLDSDSYINAYFSLDQETYAPYLDDAVIWSDPTWAEVDPNNKPIQGKAAVLLHLKQATEGISGMHYQVDHKFSSGDIEVFEGMLEYSWTDPNGNKFQFNIREVSVLTIKDNKIIKHTDYSDFKTWRKQFASQVEKSNKKR